MNAWRGVWNEKNFFSSTDNIYLRNISIKARVFAIY